MDVKIRFEGEQGSGKSLLLTAIVEFLQAERGFVLTRTGEHEITVHRPLKTLHLNLKQSTSSSNTTKKEK